MIHATVTPIDKIWLSNREAQSYLDAGPDFFKRLRQSGKLPFYKIGAKVFYLKRDIDNLIKRSRVC